MTTSTAAHTFTEDDATLIDLYTDPEVSLRAVRAELGISYAELERRLAQPHIREALERLARLHEQRAKTLARCAADDAATTLTQLVFDDTANPETRRKAASHILRAVSAPHDASEPTLPPSPSRPSPANAIPRWDRRPACLKPSTTPMPHRAHPAVTTTRGTGFQPVDREPPIAPPFQLTPERTSIAQLDAKPP